MITHQDSLLPLPLGDCRAEKGPLPLVVAYGGGKNSAAMLLGFREREIRPDLLLFANTKGEKPETYDHLREISALCQVWWGKEVIEVRKLYQNEHEGLEDECLRKKMLPSLAYGRKGCSMKHKVEPQNRYVRQWMDDAGVMKTRRAIGYHAGEGHRSVGKKTEDLGKGRMSQFWYPLIEWQWRERECVEAVARHGIFTPPGKSACFFCPAMKRHEIVALKRDHPELYERAVKLEETAVTRKQMGLTGGHLKWSDITQNDEEQQKLWDWADEHAPSAVPCGCFDA